MSIDKWMGIVSISLGMDNISDNKIADRNKYVFYFSSFQI